jgi:hypothetical protein
MREASHVTVRLLPDETAASATVRAVDGREVELDPGPEVAGLQPGALVEIESLDTLCLGQVAWCGPARILVTAEHTVDLHKLARIQEVWDAPEA